MTQTNVDSILSTHPSTNPDATPDYVAMLAVALKEARIGLAEGGLPIGAAIFRIDGTLVSQGRNRRVQQGDPSIHGETDAFRAAGRQASYRNLIMVTDAGPLLVLQRPGEAVRVPHRGRRGEREFYRRL